MNDMAVPNADENGDKRKKVQKQRLKARKGLSLTIKIALLAALAFGLMYLEFPLTFLFPPWLKFDFGDIPAILGAFAFGPWAGIAIEAVKNALFLWLKNSGTAGIGELANFLLGVALVLPVSIYYYWKKNRGTAILSIGIGVVLMTVMSGVLNMYLLIPAYSNFMPVDAIIAMCKAINPSVDTVAGYVLYMAMPFTLIKAFLEGLITFLVYKRLSKVLHKF
jgi:riboflavin transporter